MNLGIKIDCSNCKNACPQRLERWECVILFSPSREALTTRIKELQQRLKMLEELKDVDGLRRDFRAHTAALVNVLIQRTK